ncbi:MAG: hypothetical protein P4L65_03000 [Legionella sp.]|nr:hypothetical protein [Legionella sp.]
MYQRKDMLNSRGYAQFLKIAQNATKTINKIKICMDQSSQQHGNSQLMRPDIEYIFFDIQQLRMICFDYAFSALENFLEHIGFILFYDWDSERKQRHYNDKQTKLLCFSEIIEKEHQPSLDYATLELEWNAIICSVTPGNYNIKRNPIKHIHSGKHDVKTQTVSSTSTMMYPHEYEELVKDTLHDFSDNDCFKLMTEVEALINSIHSFLQKNKLIFRIYCDYETDEEIENRKSLLDIFLVQPLADTIYSSGLTSRNFSPAN